MNRVLLCAIAVDLDRRSRALGNADREPWHGYRSAIIAIFDRDSVCACPEAVLMGAARVHFTTRWSESSTDPLPSSPDESSAFVKGYEEARGRRFGSRERELVDAAQIYRLAYGARCEHSDRLLGVFPDADGASGFASLLRTMAT